jgi:molybdopterin-guanine dinucleotide biosynthesis protein A
MKLSAVLLAGGKSRRMGQDKATLLFAGEALWQRQMRTLRQLRGQKIFISARAAPKWLLPEMEVVLDEAPSRGPLSGIVAALGRTETSHLFVLAVDMPFVTAAHAHALWRGARERSGVVPVIGGRAEPLAAVYPRDAEDEFAAALRNGELSLQPLVERMAAAGKVRMVEISEAEAGVYRSLNKPGDLTCSGAL